MRIGLPRARGAAPRAGRRSAAAEEAMLDITLSPEAVAKLRGLLDEEDGDAVLRVREVKVGGG